MIKIIEPHVELVSDIDSETILKHLETCGRTCYKSEDKTTENSAQDFVRKIIKAGHESVLEHASLTVRFVCDRSTSHQLVRHRIAAYSQESQRYCNYNKNNELEVICPPSIKETDNGVLSSKPSSYVCWMQSVENAYKLYKYLVQEKIRPEDARSILPNCVKTEVVTTFNLRMWRHVFKERALNKRAQWQIRELMLQTLKMFQEEVPVVFEDLKEEIL
jgi:thymidylate synthase (FAD)